MITDQVITSIIDFELTVADLSFLNPNVFYELALRHMAAKPVVMIANTGTKLPFDTAGMNTIFFNIKDYQSHKKTREALAKYASAALDPSYQVSNPVTSARKLATMSQSSDTTEQMLAMLVQRVTALEATEVAKEAEKVPRRPLKLTDPPTMDEILDSIRKKIRDDFTDE